MLLIDNAVARRYKMLKQEEDFYRRLFATQRNHPLLQNPCLMLVDVHKYMDLFHHEKMDEGKLDTSHRQACDITVLI
jgi:hypothetical protein